MPKPSQREADRNQKELEALMEIPENRVCADCTEPKPKWASSTLGIFLCIDCAGLHRNLPRELSTIKSVKADMWSDAEIAVMRSMGNRKSNALYLADGTLGPPKPTDSDLRKHVFNALEEGGGKRVRCNDKVMYNFIKDKYKRGTFMRERDRREVAAKWSKSSNDKSGGKNVSFGSGSGSGSADRTRLDNVAIDPDDHVTFSGQLKLLTSMGFTDTTKCIKALKKFKGSVDAAVEVLISLPAGDETKSPAASASVNQKGKSSENVSETLRQALEFLRGMGFTNDDENMRALKLADGSLDEAVVILASNPAPRQDTTIPKATPTNASAGNSGFFGMDLLSLSDSAPQAIPYSDPFSGSFVQSSVQPQTQSPHFPQSISSQPQSFNSLQSFNSQQGQMYPQQFQQQQQGLSTMLPMGSSLGMQPGASQAGINNQQLQLSSQQQQQVKFTPNYSPQISLGSTSSSVFGGSSHQSPQRLNPQNDPFAALLKDSKLLPSQQQSVLSPSQVSFTQQTPIGFMGSLGQQQSMIGNFVGSPSYNNMIPSNSFGYQQQSEPAYSTYTGSPQVPFGSASGYQVPRNALQFQQQQQDQQHDPFGQFQQSQPQQSQPQQMNPFF